MKLTFNQLADQKNQANFMTFVYQEKDALSNNRMVVFDIVKNEISGCEHINPS